MHDRSMEGSCHCGAVRIRVAAPPEWVGQCNCSVCRKLAGLFAYYPPADVSVEGETVGYVWGDRTISIRHCPVCGCTTHWESLMPDYDRMGVNARMLDGFDPARLEVRPIDGASF